MSNDFLESNFFQTLVLIVTALITIFLYLMKIRSELRNNAIILISQIKEIEKNIQFVKSECLLNGVIYETPIHYSNIIFNEIHWDRCSFNFVEYVSQSSFEKLDSFFFNAKKVREQQIYIKNKIQQGTEFRIMNYYTAIYGIIANKDNYYQETQSIHKRFDEATIQSYITKELAIGLEKALKEYQPLTDGKAFNELLRCKKYPFLMMIKSLF